MSTALKVAIEANDPEGVSKAVKDVKDINCKLRVRFIVGEPPSAVDPLEGVRTLLESGGILTATECVFQAS